MNPFEQGFPQSKSGKVRFGNVQSGYGVIRTDLRPRMEAAMLWTIAVILIVLWLLGVVVHVGGGLIHLLLVIAIIVGLVQLFTGRHV